MIIIVGLKLILGDHTFLENIIKLYICIPLHIYEASLGAKLVKNPPVTQETPVQFLGQEDPLEKG